MTSEFTELNQQKAEKILELEQIENDGKLLFATVETFQIKVSSLLFSVNL